MDKEPDSQRLIIGVVGPCGSGKTTLINNLSHLAVEFHHIAQEHSYVKDMWRKVTDPDLLIFLEADLETILERKSFTLTQKDYQIQMRRLEHALEHADLIIDTNNLTSGEISQIADEFISKILN